MNQPNEIKLADQPAITARDLGIMAYRTAWGVQEQAHSDVFAGGPSCILFVEHLPVITFGRRGPTAEHLLASAAQLEAMGVELIESDRGGDVTFHGAGQLVAYPIIRLADHHLSVSGYVHSLERAAINALAEFNVYGETEASAVGVWVNDFPSTGIAERSEPIRAKICAIGVRIRRGVSLHGLALNVTTDLSQFGLINPCGLSRPVTSLQNLLGDRTPKMDVVKEILLKHLRLALSVDLPCGDRSDGRRGQRLSE